MKTYTWKGKEKKVLKKCPFQSQAYLALLNHEHIRQRVWMKEQNGKRISEFEDKTDLNSFRFDMQTKSKRDDGYYYCIQMQSNRESQSSQVPGIPSHSYCDVQIHENATPSPTVFLDACWSSAEQNHIQVLGKDRPKTMAVVIYSDNHWENLETGEVGYDEEAKMEADKKEMDEMEKRIESGNLTNEDYKNLFSLKKKK